MREEVQRPLTWREIECLEWLDWPLGYMETATTLGITVATVALHVGSARRKLGATTTSTRSSSHWSAS